MRARLALLLAQQTVTIRAIVMTNKPVEMLQLSPKGTVPVLLLDNMQVIDESLDIMLWALNMNDPDDFLYSDDANALQIMLKIITENDEVFVPKLKQYKHAKRFHNDNEDHCRQQCEPFVQQLESRLAQHDFLMGSTPSLLDYALLPFIRQFSRVNRPLYLQGPYLHLRRWLSYHLQSQLFSRAMLKYPLWLDKHEECLLGD